MLVSVKEASKILERTEQFVRCALKTGKLPIGFAVKMSTVYTYDIRSHMLSKYAGISECELVEQINELREKSEKKFV